MKWTISLLLALPLLYLLGHAIGEQSPLIAEDQIANSLEPQGRYAKLLNSPHVHDYLAMNSQSEICENTRPCVNKGRQNPNFSYDPIENAFKADTLGRSDINSSWQIRRYFPPLSHRNSTKVSFQWEFKYGAGYLSTGMLRNYKAFQLSGGSEDLMFEYQHRFSLTDESAVALPTFRYYRNLKFSEASDRDPLSSWGPALSNKTGKPIDNWQPGGDTAAEYKDAPFSASDHLEPAKHSPFIIRADIWTRVTTEFTYTDNEQRVCIWMSDELTEPTLVFASVKEPGKCFLISSDISNGYTFGFQNWWIELDSSQKGLVPGLTSWFRNFVVYKDASIPLN